MPSYFLGTFLGYISGRLGHILGGQIWWVPHHWIIGAVIMLFVAVIWKKSRLKKQALLLILFFGLGVFISDFKDFTALKTWEPEDVQVVRFWGID